MNPRRSSPSAPPRAAAAFTLIEITIALAVVAFALVAIVGVLPIGLNVQRDNRAETIVQHDGAYWMEALRGGAQGLDELVNHVEFIVLEGPAGRRVVRNGLIDPTEPAFRTGREIVGLLGTFEEVTNAYALVRSLTGVATEKPGANTSPNSPGLEFAFKYRLQVTMVQADDYTTEDFNTALGLPQENLGPAEPLRTLYDIRLRLSWPVIKSDAATGAIDLGRRQKSFRSMASRYRLEITNLVNTVNPPIPGNFLVP
ncbi:MAG: hypothetical protein RJA22_1760 [Verrucomicrobiota bacterium]|jgi:hypothetical protein